MSDFLKGVGAGVVGSNGIAGVIQKMAMLPYLRQQAEQNARYKASAQAVNDVRVRESERNMQYIEDVINGFIDRDTLAGAMAASKGNHMYGNSNVKGAALDYYKGSMPVGNQVAFDNEQNFIKAKTAHENAEKLKAVTQAYKARRSGSGGGNGSRSKQLITDENGYRMVADKGTSKATYLKDDSGMMVGSPPRGRATRSGSTGRQTNSGGFTYEDAKAVAAEQVKAGNVSWNKADNILRSSFGKGFRD